MVSVVLFICVTARSLKVCLGLGDYLIVYYKCLSFLCTYTLVHGALILVTDCFRTVLGSVNCRKRCFNVVST